MRKRCADGKTSDLDDVTKNQIVQFNYIIIEKIIFRNYFSTVFKKFINRPHNQEIFVYQSIWNTVYINPAQKASNQRHRQPASTNI